MPSERRAARTTRIVFFAAGSAMAAWAPLVPFAKAHAGVDNGVFGLVLLCFGSGSLIAMPLAGTMAARRGGHVVILTAATVTLAALASLALATQPLALALALLLFGAGLGSLDVAMNLQAIAVERAAGRAMMSGFHGLFSFGGIIGSSSVALALTAGVAPVVAIGTLAALLGLAIVGSRSGLLSRDDRPDAVDGTTRPIAFAWPHGVVLVIALLAAAAFLVEGAVLDWSAIFMTTIRDLPIARASAGYVAFSIAMTAGRFGGDRVVQHFGGRAVLVAGAMASACGLAIVALVPSWRAGIAGFALVGIGCSNIVPVLFTSVGRQTTMPQRFAVPAMTTLGYAGLLAGPALIGFVAHVTSLPVAFGVLAASMVAVALVGRRLAT